MNKPKKDTNRIAKVNSFIQKALGEILLEQVEANAIITVTKVDTSRDMKWAKIWVSLLGGDDTKTMAMLTRNIYDIQGQLNRRFSSKIVPRISFHLDTSPRYAQHIEELVKKIHEEN